MRDIKNQGPLASSDYKNGLDLICNKWLIYGVFPASFARHDVARYMSYT